jgi:DNA-binding NarL/FixJ family response regulator
MDFHMPGLDGLKASLLRKKPDAPIPTVSVFASQQLANEAKKGGIEGLCPKSEPTASLKPSKCCFAGKNIFRRWCSDRTIQAAVHLGRSQIDFFPFFPSTRALMLQTWPILFAGTWR